MEGKSEGYFRIKGLAIWLFYVIEGSCNVTVTISENTSIQGLEG